MSHPVLTSLASERQVVTSRHDQVQIALAIADAPVLKSLLVNSTPPIAPADRIGAIVDARIGVPLAAKKAVDGILHFEEIHCVLADAPPQVERSGVDAAGSSNHRGYSRNTSYREYARLTQHESEVYTLGQSISQAQAITLLTHAGFSTRQGQEILQLSHEASHKSWWYAVDATGQFTIPFRRLMRTLHYLDGSVTLQYKDYFDQEKPTCFKSRDQKVLIEIQAEPQSFRKTLEKINYSRAQLGVERAILIGDRLSDLEARGLISQGISIYGSEQLLLPVQANCRICAHHACAFNGKEDSPIRMCQQFCLNAE